MKYLTTAALLVVGVCSGAFVRPNTEGRFELLILHNNDMHARFEQTSYLSGACTKTEREAGKCYGGFARVAYVVNKAREDARDGKGPPVLYLNAGDTYTGTAWFTIYKWQIAAEFINALQPDAVSLGNNEVQKGSTDVPPFLNNIDTKILACNVLLKSAVNNEKIQKSVVFDVHGVHVGVVGYLTPNVLDESDEIEYINEVIAVKEEVEKLKAMNVNIIIALGHSTANVDEEIAKEVDGLDLIIVGEKNIFNWDGTTTSYAAEDEPIIITQDLGRQVPIVSSSSYNKYLGRLLISFDTDGEVIEYDPKPILLDETIPQNEQALQMIESHYSEIASRFEEVVGSTAVVLDGSVCKTEECNLGNLITDAINYYYALRFEGDNWTDAAITIIHSAAIAGSIAPSNRPATVTRGDLLSVLPQESNLVVVTMNGTILNEVLEHSVATYNAQTPTGQLLQFSGIRATYDMSRDPGSRLVDAVVRCHSCFVPDFYVIDDWRTYKVIMPAALADGAYGYTMLTDLPKEILVYDEVTCTADYISARSPVYPEIADRIVLNNVDQAADEVNVEESVTEEDGNEENVTDGNDNEEGVTDSPDSANIITSSLVLLSFLPILMF